MSTETRETILHGCNIYTGEPWTLTIHYLNPHGMEAVFFVEALNLNKCYKDPYLAMREMYDAGLLTPGQYEDAVFSLMRDHEGDLQ